MKQSVKNLLYAVAPRWTTSLMSARARAHSQRVIAGWGCGPITEALVERFGNRVLDGPFAGLALTPRARAEQLGPYLLGVYESELDAAWDTVFKGSYTQIIDIGAKFGYYAVGLARRYPTATVVAFDTDAWARAAVREMATANGVDNVRVEGFCGPEWLETSTEPAAFIISDCEGYEAQLFTPRTLPKLQTATLIIETHDCFVPGVDQTLRQAFAQTHHVHVIGPDAPRRTTTHSLDFLTEPQKQLAQHEVRPPQFWLLCLPKSGTNQHYQ